MADNVETPLVDEEGVIPNILNGVLPTHAPEDQLDAAPSVESPEVIQEEPYVDFTGMRPQPIVGVRGTEHGGLLYKRSDGSGVFRPTSYEGTAPHFRGTHNDKGDIEFSSLSELANKLP